MAFPPNSRIRFLVPKFFAAGLCATLVSLGGARAVLVDFTSAEGYANGTLNGQTSSTPVWVVSSGATTSFTVDAAAGIVSLDPTTSNRIAGYNSAIDFTSGLSYTTSIDFTFVQSGSTTASSTTLAGLIYAENVNSASVSTTLAGFGRQGSTVDGYRVAFANGSVGIAGTSLGIDSASGDVTSDVIRLTYTLQQGASSSTWVGTETIFNVTTNTVVATRSSSAINISTADPTSLFGAMQIGASMSTSGLSSFSVLSYNSPVAVPEPAVSLLALAGVGLLATRRRRLG